MKTGVALNPHTAVDLLEPIINEIDLVCLMSVNPGFGGQSFIETTYEKVKKLSTIIEKSGARPRLRLMVALPIKTPSNLLNVAQTYW